MKKSLILLPLAAMFLSSCGGANGELPSGGDVVDPTKEEDVTNYAVRLADCVQKTVVGSKNGVKVTGTVKVDDLTVNAEGEGSMSAKDLEFTVSLAADFLDKESINDWKIAAEITAKGNFKISVPSANVNLDLNLDDFKLGAYLSEGVVYLDLSNEKLGSIVKTVVGQVAGSSSSLVLPIINEILVKNKLAGISELVKVPTLSSNVIDDQTKLMISGYAAGIIAEVAKNEQYKDLLKFVSYNDGRLGLGLSVNDASVFKEEGADLSGKMNAAVLFDKDGKLASISEGGELNVKVSEDSKEVANVHYKGESSLTFEYGKAISMPNFSDYVDSKIPSYISLLLSDSSSILPILEPALD